jgi:hypothetical protein
MEHWIIGQMISIRSHCAGKFRNDKPSAIYRSVRKLTRVAPVWQREYCLLDQRFSRWDFPCFPFSCISFYTLSSKFSSYLENLAVSIDFANARWGRKIRGPARAAFHAFANLHESDPESWFILLFCPFQAPRLEKSSVRLRLAKSWLASARLHLRYRSTLGRMAA